MFSLLIISILFHNDGLLIRRLKIKWGVTKIRMLRWMYDKIKKYRIKNEYIQNRLG